MKLTGEGTTFLATHHSTQNTWFSLKALHAGFIGHLSEPDTFFTHGGLEGWNPGSQPSQFVGEFEIKSANFPRHLIVLSRTKRIFPCRLMATQMSAQAADNRCQNSLSLPLWFLLQLLVQAEKCKVDAKICTQIHRTSFQTVFVKLTTRNLSKTFSKAATATAPKFPHVSL